MNPDKTERGSEKSPNEIKEMESDMKKMSHKQQANEILKLAEETGLTNNYFFVTTFERYQVQLEILDTLKESINADGLTVTKEYVKGRKNLYTNPAVSEFNRTTDSANKTVATLLRIIKSFDVDTSKEETDPLIDIINGGDPDDKE